MLCLSRVFASRGHRVAPGAALFAALLTLLATLPAHAQAPLSWVVTIDSGTYLPVSVGFIPANANGDVLILAEGALRTVSLPNRFDQGWFGPAGMTNGQSASQPILSGMPYGALIRGFGNNVAAYQYAGRMGSTALQPAHVGQELKLALNLSNADLATMEGQLTVTVIYLPDGSADQAQVELGPTSVLPVGTGIFLNDGDRIVVLPYGQMADPSLPNSALTGGSFGPEGLLGLLSPTQPYPRGPYGAVFGYIVGGSGFSIGDGGCWDTQPADLGQELQLTLNTSAASLAGMTGKFSVHVVRVPAPDPTQVDPTPVSDDLDGFGASPNPMRESTAIHFRLAEEAVVRLRIFDAQGRQVRTLVEGRRAVGEQFVTWDGRDAAGQRQSAGTYFYQLSQPEGSRTGRIVVLD